MRALTTAINHRAEVPKPFSLAILLPVSLPSLRPHFRNPLGSAVICKVPSIPPGFKSSAWETTYPKLFSRWSSHCFGARFSLVMEKRYPPPVIRSHPTQVKNCVSDSTAEPLSCFALWHLLTVQKAQRCTLNILSEHLMSSYFHIFDQGTSFVSELFWFVVSDKVFSMLHMQATLALFSKQSTDIEPSMTYYCRFRTTIQCSGVIPEHHTVF